MNCRHAQTKTITKEHCPKYRDLARKKQLKNFICPKRHHTCKYSEQIRESWGYDH